MKLPHIFTDRPILATVLSLVIIIIGTLSYFSLPVNQYPDIVPPTIEIRASLPGASAKTVSEVVATPLEQEINGVENMIYMQSQATDDGNLTITVTFELGTDIDDAQVQVQNRVARAEPRLPQQTRQLGVTTLKNSPNFLMVVNLLSPDKSYDQLYISNYATLRIRDQLSRIDGVGNVMVFGGSEYAMRVWVDPDRMTTLNITSGDVLGALRAQNVQVASGNLNQEPNNAEGGAFRINVQTQGRLESKEEFEQVIVKEENGRIVRLEDIARVELGAQSYTTRSYLGKNPGVALGVFQRPGSNAIEAADEVLARMEEFSEDFPAGLEYKVLYNPTEYVEQSLNEVYRTIIEAIILVVIVIVLFLQSFRASIIPILAIPISLIGTFAIMNLLGFSLNNLTLFGLVLAIGIVVDDAIVVVEDAARNIEEGMSPREAVHKTMDEVGAALVSMVLVLAGVFIPTAFLEGISGQFFRQFALTISTATLWSLVVSLTLTPALSALILKDESNVKRSGLLKPVDYLFGKFNSLMDRLSGKYASVVEKGVRRERSVLLVYLVLIGLAFFLFNRLPGGFIPPQDQGYFITVVQLPPGASLDRTDAVVQQATDKFLDIEGVENTIAFTGLSGATFTNAPNEAVIFLPLEDFSYREEHGIGFGPLLGQLNQTAAQIQEANVFVIPPPPVQGIGNAGGFKMMVQDRSGVGSKALDEATKKLAMAANQDPAIVNAFRTFGTNTPKIFLDVDRERAERLGVNVSDLFQTLNLMVGSSYVNDFNYLGRTYQVTAQADASYRSTPSDLLNLRVRNDQGGMVPLGSVSDVDQTTGAPRVPRFNLFPAAALSGEAAPGYSTGEALDQMEKLAAETLPQGISYEWTELAYQEKQVGNMAILVFILAVVFAFLILSAQYESWLLPLAIVLIVPMCVLSAAIGLGLMGQDVNVLTQIGLVVLVGLASKNAILIVEFAKQIEENQQVGRWEAAVQAAKIRLRPILMTAFAFILGMIPLLISTGAGSEMRFAIGLTEFAGMLGVTLLGLFLTPVFYVVVRSLAKDQRNTRPPTPAIESSTSEE
ncbi:efflux RND transporter permease subunit [Fodinibius salsisoli]|uniref:Efflux RND transporter permease subunit n=1 Tax=Fodinibius salsisoli TaxID=2820877 RepID=A0ABT3PIH0_9BACT|nr:multidrug efflux RND transporter permease subunit [Fodinibius salsisoli]MCW9705548.1 efflux RND transporter permease subunit [Fodinibius salsisoli]